MAGDLMGPASRFGETVEAREGLLPFLQIAANVLADLLLLPDDIEDVIAHNDDDGVNEYGDPIGYHYSPLVIDRLREAAHSLRVAYIYAQRTDWLLSGDDGEGSFIARLDDELDKLSRGS